MHQYGGIFTVGTGGCEQLDVALEDLSAVLAAAETAGISEDPTVTAAQNLLDYRTGFWTRAYAYVPPGGSECQSHTAEVKAASARVLPLVPENLRPRATRPDYVAPPPTNLDWIKPVVIAGTAAWLLTSVGGLLPRRKR